MSLFSNKVTGLRTAPKDSFCLTQRRIQNLLKRLRWSFFKDNLLGFENIFILQFFAREIFYDNLSTKRVNRIPEAATGGVL